MAFMTRNQGAGSNTKGQWQTPANSSVEFYEQIYTTAGPQEWITLPDSGQSKVVISFPNGPGGAFLEGTCSPGDLLVGQGKSPTSPYTPVVYPLTDQVNDVTPVLVQGDTAIRINITSGIAALSVRC